MADRANHRLRNILLLCFVLGFAGIGIAIATAGWLPTWNALGVQTRVPAFLDLDTIRAAAVTMASGQDPRLTNPTDSQGRVLNYPILWAYIGTWLHLDSDANFLAFALVLAAVYLVATFRLLRSYPSIWLLAAIFSAASLLAIERGNTDLLMYALVYGAALSAPALSVILFVTAVVLKIYPAFALPAVFPDLKRAALLLGAVALFFIFDAREITLIRRATPAANVESYGVPSLALLLGGPLRASALIVPVVVALAAALLVTLRASARYGWGRGTEAAAAEARLFLAGASVFFFSFITSSNWDYRLIFLLLCIPYLMKMQYITVRTVVLTLMILAMNETRLSSALGPAGLYLAVLAKTGTFVMLGSLLFQELLRRFLGGRKATERTELVGT